MSNLRNHVQLIGHLGANPEVKNFDNGGKVAHFNMATSESYKVNDEWKEDTQWHKIVAWNGIADRVGNQLQKGSYVLVEGKLTHRSYENQSGQTQYITEVQIQNFLLLDKRKEGTPREGYAEDPAKSKFNQSQK